MHLRGLDTPELEIMCRNACAWAAVTAAEKLGGIGFGESRAERSVSEASHKKHPSGARHKTLNYGYPNPDSFGSLSS